AAPVPNAPKPEEHAATPQAATATPSPAAAPTAVRRGCGSETEQEDQRREERELAHDRLRLFSHVRQHKSGYAGRQEIWAAANAADVTRVTWASRMAVQAKARRRQAKPLAFVTPGLVP